VVEPVSRNAYSERGTGLGTALPGYLSATSEPVIVTETRGRKGKTTLTAVAMAFAPAARYVKVATCGDIHEAIRLRVLNPRQSRKAHLERFRYAAFAITRAWCPKQIQTFNGHGVLLWESGSHWASASRRHWVPFFRDSSSGHTECSRRAPRLVPRSLSRQQIDR
jgi:hypothetical protein